MFALRTMRVLSEAGRTAMPHTTLAQGTATHAVDSCVMKQRHIMRILSEVGHTALPHTIPAQDIAAHAAGSCATKQQRTTGATGARLQVPNVPAKHFRNPEVATLAVDRTAEAV